MNTPIPVVDVFAGPGGLAEGFASYATGQSPAFQIVLSVEKDRLAHQTLLLRSFFRRVPFKRLREAYIAFAKSPRSDEDVALLYEQFKDEHAQAAREAICGELGSSAFPATRLDAMIRERIGASKQWLLIGGPPCQAYSLVGRSRRSKLRKKDLAAFEADQRHLLYEHYLRILAVHRPPVFVMENVKGLLSSTLGGRLIVDRMLGDLREPTPGGAVRYRLFSFTREPRGWRLSGDPEFEPADFVIRCEDFGIPQARHRVIVLGIRSDLDAAPAVLKPADERMTVESVISDLPPLRSDLSSRADSTMTWAAHIRQSIKVCSNGVVSPEVRAVMRRAAAELDEKMSTGGYWVPYRPGRPPLLVGDWYRRHDIGGVCNHEVRSHRHDDLQRYFFASSFAQTAAPGESPRSPSLKDFPRALLPDHKNIDAESIEDAVFADRFRVQIPSSPGSTVTSHIAKDGHYFIHPDPRQCRSLTVREAARIQTFPDSYIFLGPRTAQYQQVGNAVPPLLASQLAGVIAGFLRT